MFKFSIRDLLWLTLVVAVGLGWFVHQWQLNAELKSTRNDNATAVFLYELQIKGLEQELRTLKPSN
jgi:hypothetical protein